MDLVEATRGGTQRRHPWETARASFFLRLLADAGCLKPGVSVLDVGAGDAWFASRLADATPGLSVTCWDTGYESSGVQLPDHPSLRFVAAPPAGRFGLALLLDVLEHIEDDASFLRSIVDERLAPGAAVLVSVPAWPRLFSEHDRRLRHHRRYAPAAARALLVRSGLRVERSGGLFHALLLPRLAMLTLFSFREPADAGSWRHGALATALTDGVLAADNALSRFTSTAGFDLPGLSWWALCRKP